MTSIFEINLILQFSISIFIPQQKSLAKNYCLNINSLNIIEDKWQPVNKNKWKKKKNDIYIYKIFNSKLLYWHDCKWYNIAKA